MNFNYLYVVSNTSFESVVKLIKANNNQLFVFKFSREYFDQMFNVKAMLRSLFKLLFSFSRFERLLHEDHDIPMMSLPFPNSSGGPPATPGSSSFVHKSGAAENRPASPFKRDENGDEITTVPFK